MPSVNVVDTANNKISTTELSPNLFDQKPNGALVHEVVRMQRAGERQGTASTLRRGEVSGSGKKPWKQKHTGRARAGSLRSPVWRHGGTVFGPKPRSYGYSMPRAKYHRAVQVALSAKLAEGAVLVISDFGEAAARTKSFVQSLAAIGAGDSALIVGAATDVVRLRRAARNLPGVKIVTPEEISVYDILKYRALVIAQPALGRLQEVWV